MYAWCDYNQLILLYLVRRVQNLHGTCDTRSLIFLHDYTFGRISKVVSATQLRSGLDDLQDLDDGLVIIYLLLVGEGCIWGQVRVGQATINAFILFGQLLVE